MARGRRASHVAMIALAALAAGCATGGGGMYERGADGMPPLYLPR
jgi:hypothetical protein